MSSPGIRSILCVTFLLSFAHYNIDHPTNMSVFLVEFNGNYSDILVKIQVIYNVLSLYIYIVCCSFEISLASVFPLKQNAVFVYLIKLLHMFLVM